jgi:dGTPase
MEEETRLAPAAARSSRTRGREKPISPDDLRTEFQRDRDRIIHSKSFRRLKDKTQMVLMPAGDHYRTRLSHTLEVSQVARTIARALRLNEDLTEAVALGHDLGHTPFGHMGERTLDRLYPEGFLHNEQSLRQIDVIENCGEGLNLTWEVREDILRHSGALLPETLEGWCVRYADRIAYVNHDIDDSIRAGMLDPGELPKECIRVLGKTPGARISRMVADIVEHSADRNALRMSDEVREANEELRAFLNTHVYRSEWAQREEKKIDGMLQSLYRHLVENPSLMPRDYAARCDADGDARCVVDYIAGMTDRFAVRLFRKQFIPVVVAGGV